MDKLKVLVADPISPRGVEDLQRDGAFDVIFQTGLKEDQLLEIIPDCAALVVRSETKVNQRVLDAAKALRVVGRAGVGVDNVDVEAATARGVIVMNTPDGNTISTAEHAFSLLVSIARTIPQAHASVAAGKWERKKFQGVELYGKTLAILGMGRIGGELARRAIAFGMRVLAYDPYLAASRARAMQVELIEDLDEILPRADFISMHMPLTPETHHMLDARRLALCKAGVRIVNCARGGLIDEAALLPALESGHVAGCRAGRVRGRAAARPISRCAPTRGWSSRPTWARAPPRRRKPSASRSPTPSAPRCSRASSATPSTRPASTPRRSPSSGRT